MSIFPLVGCLKSNYPSGNNRSCFLLHDTLAFHNLKKEIYIINWLEFF